MAVSLLPHRMLVAVSAAIGALSLVGSVGLTVAHADPTPTPTSTQAASPTPGPTPSADLTPDPTPSPDGTADPVTTPTPTPSPTSAPTKTKAAATAKTKAVRSSRQLRRAALLRAAAGGRVAAGTTAATADDRFSYTLTTTCPTPTVFPQAEITLTSRLSVDLTLYYALGGGGLNISGSVTVPALGSAVVNAELLSESTDFVVRFYDDPDLVGTGAWVASQDFTVAQCLSGLAQCGSFRFFSSSQVPVTVVYGEGPLDQADPDDATVFVLDAGGNAAVRVDFQTLYWVAGSIQPGAGDNVVIAMAGKEPAVAIPQDCEPDPLSTMIVGCGGPGNTARATFNIEYGPTDSFALEVVNASGEVVFRRTGSAATETRGFLVYQTRLPGLGHFRFNYFLNDLTTPLESSVFQVQDCVDVEGSCRAATFSSAAGNLPPRVDWSNGADHGTFTLAPGRSRELRPSASTWRPTGPGRWNPIHGSSSPRAAALPRRSR